MVRGYHILHVYQSIWDTAVGGKNLEWFREVGNIHNPSAVAIRKMVTTNTYNSNQ